MCQKEKASMKNRCRTLPFPFFLAFSWIFFSFQNFRISGSALSGSYFSVILIDLLLIFIVVYIYFFKLKVRRVLLKQSQENPAAK